MMKLTIYQKPTCTTCRKVFKILKEEGVDFDAVDYYIDPLGKTKLKKLLKKMKLTPRQVLRTGEQRYKQLRLGEKEVSDAKLIDLLASYPELLQRPIVEKGPRALLARPPERIRELF